MQYYATIHPHQSQESCILEFRPSNRFSCIMLDFRNVLSIKIIAVWRLYNIIQNAQLIFSLQAAFLTQLVDPDAASTSFRSSLKAMSEDSPGTQLATRHCFLLEDPPNEKKDLPALQRFYSVLGIIII